MTIHKKIIIPLALALVLLGGGAVFALQQGEPEPQKDVVELSTSVQEKPQVFSEEADDVEETAVPPPTPEPEPPVDESVYTEEEMEKLKKYYGHSSYHVFIKRQEVNKILPAEAIHLYASSVYERLKNQSLSVVSAPSEHDLAYKDGGQGHIAFVEEVNPDGSIWLSSMNSQGHKEMDTSSGQNGGWGQISYRLVPADQVSTYEYLR